PAIPQVEDPQRAPFQRPERRAAPLVRRYRRIDGRFLRVVVCKRPNVWDTTAPRGARMRIATLTTFLSSTFLSFVLCLAVSAPMGVAVAQDEFDDEFDDEFE